MKLFLSSYHFGDGKHAFMKLLPSNPRVAIIANAKDLYPVEEVAPRVQEEITELAELGLTAEWIDLRKYFGKQQKLAKALSNFNVVWVLGGNAFVLLRAMKQSGFDLWLRSKIPDKTFVYGGYSAGVCVMGPTMRGYELVDDAVQVPAGYPAQTNWDAMGIVPYSVAPHYKSDHPESVAVDDVVAYFNAHNMPYKTLRDNEFIISET